MTSRVCAVSACGRPMLAKQLCQTHYDRRRRYPGVSLDWIRPTRSVCSCGTEFAVGLNGSVPVDCKNCRTERHARQMLADRWRKTLEYSYGLTIAAYDRMFTKQGGRCAICNRRPTFGRGSKNGRLSVDHNHETGKVRALLCSVCNAAIGSLRDDPALLRVAADYLDKHDAIGAEATT